MGEAISSRRRKGFLQANWATAEGPNRSQSHAATGDGECAAKKISYRVAQEFARETQYRVIYLYRRGYEVKAMCAFFGVSRAAYYAWVRRIEGVDPDAGRKELILKAYQASHRTYGYRRVTWWIAQKCGVTINPKAVLRLMNRLGIRSVARKRRIYKKMNELETYHSYPNLLNRNFMANRPNQKWVTDVTYILTREGWAYLSTIKDLYDNFIVAHQFGRENSVALVQQNLRKAKQKEKVTDGLVLHSDQGQQYTSQAYYVLTHEYNITASMSRRGNCWDNAPMENFFGHLKEEALRQYKPLSFEEAQQVIDDYICFYNYERIQLKTRQTPFQIRCLSS